MASEIFRERQYANFKPPRSERKHRNSRWREEREGMSETHLVLGSRPLSSLDLAINRYADEVEPHFPHFKHGINLLRRAFGQRQNNPLCPLLLPSHAGSRSICMKLSQSRPFSYIRY